MSEPTAAKAKFNMNRATAKRNLTARLARAPTGAEILGLVGARRRGNDENSFVEMLMQKAEARMAAKMNAKAEAAESKMAAKAAKGAVTMTRKANKAGPPKAVAKGVAAEGKKLAAEQAKLARAQAREMAKEAKRVAKEESKAAFAAIEAKARENLTRYLGKPPRVANIRKLASVRHSGVNLSIDDFMKIKQYRNTRKVNPSTPQPSLSNFKPEMSDPCAACELQKFLNRE
jgi:hypothetical protein